MTILNNDTKNATPPPPPPAGLSIERRFTTVEGGPFGGIEFTQRASRIANPDGSVVFEMPDVEVPTTWDQVAVDILASKYLRKAGVPQLDAEGNVSVDDNGDPVLGPERSIKQVALRLANAWMIWGERGGYFASHDDAAAFRDEMAYMVVTQMAAPNTPQFFNTGLFEAYGIVADPEGNWYYDESTRQPRLSEHRYERSAASACYIGAPQDELVGPGSIFEFIEDEARLFKAGSGSGANFSAIRGKGEKLSAGGSSSGVMSFLKVADAAAGAIKSGGSTRRAAKMVILDADHPEIETFVQWKVEEERKVAALAAGGGYSTDFNGEAYATVSGQNGNNSVRIPEGFMDKLRADAEWALKARTTGETMKQLPARQLWDAIAQAAWTCADPGLQFDDILNDWNTVLDTERVRGTNPCFTGDTLVHTTEGLLPMIELAHRSIKGETFEVYTHDATGEHGTDIVATPVEAFHITGVNPVVRLTFNDGRVVRCTPNHRFWTTNQGWVRADELDSTDNVLFADAPTPATNAAWELPASADPETYRRKGDHSASIELPDMWTEDLGHWFGWLVGDGSVNGTSVCAIYSSLEDQQEIMPLHAEIMERVDGGRPIKVSEQDNGTMQVCLSRRQIRSWLAELGMEHRIGPNKRIPWSVFRAPTEVASAFLSGLFDADGCVVSDRDTDTYYVGLGSSSKALLVDTQRLLSTFGITSHIYHQRHSGGAFRYTTVAGKERVYDQKDAWDLRISSGSIDLFAQHIGFRLSRKAALLTDAVSARTPYRQSFTTSLESRVDDAAEVTYNLTEPRNNSYMVNGLVVSNCSEFTHVDNTSCNLASLNLVKFWDASNQRFLTEDYLYAARLWQLMLEITVSMSHYPSAVIAERSFMHRPTGLGYANVGALVMRAGLPYDSDATRAVVGALTSLMNSTAYTTSAELAAAVGPAPEFHANAGSALRVLRNHRRAAFGSLARSNGLGDYEQLTVRPVEIDHLVLAHTPFADLSAPVLDAAHEMVASAEAHGVRNMQVSVLAPTGTISLLMGCDTSGIEPDFALVKLKKLSGGGYMQMVNQSVIPALGALGYGNGAIESIITHLLGTKALPVSGPLSPSSLCEVGLTNDEVAAAEEALSSVSQLDWAFGPFTLGPTIFKRNGLDPDVASGSDLLSALGFDPDAIHSASQRVCGHLTVEGASALRPEHLAVFDCAVECGDGTRSIAWDAHVKVLGAAAPHLSGSISKTINMSNSASVEDVRAAYELAYEQGVKCVAIYRDGSKLSQPLNSAKSSADHIDTDTDDDHRVLPVEVPPGVSPTSFYGGHTPPRFKLPTMRPGLTWRLEVGGEEVYVRSGEYPDGTLGEIFIDWGRQGSTMRGLTSALSIALSQALQHGVPLERFVSAFRGHAFEPRGIVSGHYNLKMADSVIDAIVRVLGHYYLGRTDLVQVKEGGYMAPMVTDVATTEGDISSARAAVTATPVAVPSAGEPSPATQPSSATPEGQRLFGKTCASCGGSHMIKAGSCSVCGDCGETTGCS